MKIITTAEALRSALNLGMRPERKATIPILTYVKVSAQQIISTDLDQWTLVPLDGKGAGQVMLPYRQIIDMLKGLKGPLEIEFGSKKLGKKVSLTIGGSTFMLDEMSTANFPKFPEPAKTTLKIDGPTFKTMLTRCFFSISDQESRYTLNGALLETARDILRMVATDGHRLSLVEIPMEDAPKFQALIPRAALDYLKTRIGDVVEVGMTEKDLTIRTGDIVMMSRKLTGQFPNWQAVMPTTLPIKVRVDDNIYTALERIAKSADSRSGCVRWAFGPQTTISATSSERGTATATLPISSPTRIVFGANAEFIMQFLKAIGNVPFEFALRDPQSAAMLSVENFKYLVMPMRL